MYFLCDAEVAHKVVENVSRYHHSTYTVYRVNKRSRQSGPGGKPDKTKYMKFSASPFRRSMKGATINGVPYEGVAGFIYLGTLISNDNTVHKEIQRRILPGSRTSFAAISRFRNRLLSRATKIRLYKTLTL